MEAMRCCVHNSDSVFCPFSRLLFHPVDSVMSSCKIQNSQKQMDTSIRSIRSRTMFVRHTSGTSTFVLHVLVRIGESSSLKIKYWFWMLRNDNKTHKTVYAYTNSPSSFRCSNSQTIASYRIVLLCSHRSLFSATNTCCYRTTMRIRLATSSVSGRCTRKIPLPRWWWLDDDDADADNGNDEVNGENRAK